jgi:hypothetical protein
MMDPVIALDLLDSVDQADNSFILTPFGLLHGTTDGQEVAGSRNCHIASVCIKICMAWRARMNEMSFQAGKRARPVETGIVREPTITLRY